MYDIIKLKQGYIIDKKTVRFLNISDETRVRQISTDIVKEMDEKNSALMYKGLSWMTLVI